MMNLAPFILGLIWGFLRKVPIYAIFSKRFNWHKFALLIKRRFRSCFRKRFRVYPVLILSFLIGAFRQNTFILDRFGEESWYASVWTIIAVLQYVAMLYFLFRNRFKPGAMLIFIGTVMNGLAIVLNHGQMPVGSIVQRYGQDTIDRIAAAPHYVLADAATSLAFLGDIIPFWLLGWFMISLGDIPIIIGIFRLAAYLPRRIVRRQEAGKVRFDQVQ